MRESNDEVENHIVGVVKAGEKAEVGYMSYQQKDAEYSPYVVQEALGITSSNNETISFRV